MLRVSGICFLFLAAMVTVEASDADKKKHLKECFSKEMDKENKDASADLKLTDDQLEKIKIIVYDEINKEPLKRHSEDEQKSCYKRMEEAAKVSMPEVKQEKIDKILHKVKEMSMHCLKEM